MKNFILKECGVSEISQREMVEINGGGPGGPPVGYILTQEPDPVAVVVISFLAGVIKGFLGL